MDFPWRAISWMLGISASTTGDPPCFRQATELAKRVAEEAIGGEDPITLDVP